ncbi:hypothetical protein, partial [Pseudodesulfovibrio pelocollis]|uniref:hypothetical protein n=1 Tax=Pseudodesulfovibrio pelocollis TaxID=3051432 RepID=UPI00255B200F
LFFDRIYGRQRFDAVHFDVQLLVALRFVDEVEGYLFSQVPNLRFVDFGDKFFQLKSDVLLYYRKKFPERLKILGKVAANASST